MKRLIKAILPTLVLGLAWPTMAAEYGTQQQPSAQADQQQLPADASNAQAGQDSAKKHPPTSVMDRATPAEKASDNAGTKGKHPPAKVMGRATPDLKSPSSAASDSQSSSESTQDSGAPK